MAMALRSPLSLLTRAARFLTCGADFLCLPVRWSGRFVWRLRFAKPADFLLFLFVAPIVCMIDVRTDWECWRRFSCGAVSQSAGYGAAAAS